MAKRDKQTLKGYFKTNSYPTEANFADLVDSFIHLDDGVTMENVQGLTEYINERNNSLLTTINDYFDNAAGKLQLERRISFALEKTEGEIFLDEPMTIYKVAVKNISALFMIVDGEEMEIELNPEDREEWEGEELQIEIDPRTLAAFKIEREQIEYKSFIFLYARAKIDI